MRATFYLMPAILAAAAVPAAYDLEAVAWSRLELEASKFFLTARSEVELAARPSAQAASELLAPGQGQGLAPRWPESGVLDIRTRILSRDSRVRFWFDPGDARALQRSSHDTSKKKLRHRIYRYTSGGVFSRTLRPADGEGDRPWASWSQVDDRFFSFDPAAAGVPVTEAAGLLYLVPAGDLRAPGDQDRLRVFTRGQVREVDVAVVGSERLEVDYVEVSGGGERTVDGKIETLKIAIRPRAGAGEDGSDFKLLGLEGDIDIYLEPRTRVPLMVSGKVDVVGTVRLRLRRAVLR